jgi:hypothetical protein
MAVEKRRGCGYRKVGGIYLAGEEVGEYCHALPLPTTVCPACKGGIKQTRGLTWIDPVIFFGKHCELIEMRDSPTNQNPEPISHCDNCPACNSRLFKGAEVGLVWIGEKYYPSPAHFLKEGAEQGFSRRIPAIPKGFKIGESWVALGHPKAIQSEPPEYDPPQAGIFKVWKPQRIEIIVTQTQSEDADFMKPLAEKGLTPVIVPDDDPDHE